MHRRIFEKMLDLSERSQPIDLVMLKEELERSGRPRPGVSPRWFGRGAAFDQRRVRRDIVKEKATLL